MRFLSIVTIAIGAFLAENIVFTHLLGITPFLKKAHSIRSSLHHGLPTALGIAVASLLAWFFDALLIRPLGLDYLRSVIFVLIAACALKIASDTIKKKEDSSVWFSGLSISAVTSSTALLGVMLLCAERELSFFESVAFGVFAGAGYLAMCLLFASVREKLEYSTVPKWLEGLPMVLITAALIALAFSGFSGIKFI